MSEPTERLTSMREVPTGQPLPAAEVRRRGDRMRHRRQAGQLVAATAVVAAIASGAVALTGRGSGDPPVAGPSSAATPEDGQVMEIPESFPLARGLPEPGGDVPEWDVSRGREASWPGLPCPTDTDSFTTVLEADGQRTDARSVVVRPPSEVLGRLLAVYPDPAVAQRAMGEIREAAETCGPSLGVAGQTEFRYAVTEVQYGGQPGLLIGGAEYLVESGEPAGAGRSVNLVVRVGNALLLTSLSDEATADPLSLDEPRAAALAASTAELAGEMCVFATEPCG